MRKRRIAIVGGGAAGLVAAVRAAEVVGERARGAAGANVEVVVYEAADRVGKSILVTGNGRCNFSNAHIDPALYRNATFVAEALAALEENEGGVGGSTVEALAVLEASEGEAAGAPMKASEGGVAGAEAVGKASASEGESAACTRRPSGDGLIDAAKLIGDYAPSCPTAVHRFFAERGLVWRTEGEGRQYPVSGKASAVLDVLRASAAALGVREACGAAVERIEVRGASAQGGSAHGEGSSFLLRFGDGSAERADAVVLACGGTVARGLLPDEVPFIDAVPVLGPLSVREKKVAKALDGIRVKARATLLRDDAVVAAERGEVLLRSYGVSGIAVFNLSRFAEPGDVLELDLLDGVLGGGSSDEFGEGRAGTPCGEVSASACGASMRACEAKSGGAAGTAAEAKAESIGTSGAVRGADFRVKRAASFLRARRDVLTARGLAATCEALFDGLLLPAVARMVVKRAGLDAQAAPDDAACDSLALVLTRFRFVVEGAGDVRQCQVHRGGCAVEAFDARTMEARAVPGLFVVGEALDVDAPCGGYNLHWAWTSGLLAGRAAVERIVGDAVGGRGGASAHEDARAAGDGGSRMVVGGKASRGDDGGCDAGTAEGGERRW